MEMLSEEQHHHSHHHVGVSEETIVGLFTDLLSQESSSTSLSGDSVQFSSAAQLCPTLLDPMHCSTPGLPVHHQFPESTRTHVHWVTDAIQPTHPVIPFSSRLQSSPASGSFQMSQFFASGGQNIGVSASASVLPMNIQDWFPLRLTGWISLLSLII